MDIKEAFLELQMIILFLGEKNQFNWWDTSFLTNTGIDFLKISFPRIPYVSAFNSTRKAARLLHDESISKENSYHLFKFPIYQEEIFYRQVNETNIKMIYSGISSKESAIQKLKVISHQVIQSPEGSVQIGSEKSLFTENSIHEIAAHYYDAFTSNKKVYPYFR